MFRAPRALPPISMMLEDLPASLDQVARLLELKPSTLAQYRRQDFAPRSVQLAIFWETQWGRSAADAEAHNAALYARQLAKGLQLELARLAGVVWKLEIELQRQAGQLVALPANLPVFRMR